METEAFDDWDELDDKKLMNAKGALLFAQGRINLTNIFTDFYRPLITSWVVKIQMMFRRGDEEKLNFNLLRTEEPEDATLVLFDEETIGGHVTWEKFWGILKQ